MITRRSMMTATVSAGIAAAVLLRAPGARALGPDAAQAHVRMTVDRVLALVKEAGSPESKAGRLAAILKDVAAMPQIARFAAGVAWRDMSDAQQGRYSEAFLNYLSTVYARRFQDYSGQTVEVGRVTDEGKRGLMVASTVTQTGAQPIKVDWLVTDRPGRTVIADIVIEGVSLLITQREEIASMLSARGGDVDRLISDLAEL